MNRYLVSETVTLVHHIEAASEAEAIEKARARGPSEFDEIDCSPSGANGPLIAILDPEEESSE